MTHNYTEWMTNSCACHKGLIKIIFLLKIGGCLHLAFVKFYAKHAYEVAYKPIVCMSKLLDFQKKFKWNNPKLILKIRSLLFPLPKFYELLKNM